MIRRVTANEPPDTFPRSDNSIFPYALRCPLWSCRLDCACNAIWLLVSGITTEPHRPHESACTFLHSPFIDPYIRGFRQSVGGHSHHRHFIDLRRVICTQRLRCAFVNLAVLTANFRRLHRASYPDLYSQRKSEYQGERFGTLLRHSTP